MQLRGLLGSLTVVHNLAEEREMTRFESCPDYHECYEYHGNTAVELTRKKAGITIKQDWLLFDSVEEAQDFFYGNDDTCQESSIQPAG